MRCRSTIPWILAACLAAPLASAAPGDTKHPDSLQPTETIPNVSSEVPDQYYILLLKWSRDVTIGPVTARVTYLDPPLYLAWIRQSSPQIDQASFEQKLSGFPRILRFRVAYQAADRGAIHAKEWKLTLRGGGAAVQASEGHRIAPADLKSGANGDYWEDDFDYQFAVPRGFLASARKGFAVSLSSPSGNGKATWAFGAIATAPASGDDYVVYLGGVLSIVCVALLVGLFVTRPPRASVA